MISDQWDRRSKHPRPSEVEHIWGRYCNGLLDSTPVYIHRPSDSDWQSAMYNDKYKGHVVKLQSICTFQGVPIWIDRLRIGTMSDILMWDTYKPALGEEGFFLADKGYVGGHGVETPHKKLPGRDLSQTQKDYNAVIAWFRATIEHVYAQMKRFRIFGGIFRGKIQLDIEFLNDTVTVITGLLVHQILRTPKVP